MIEVQRAYETGPVPDAPNENDRIQKTISDPRTARSERRFRQ